MKTQRSYINEIRQEKKLARKIKVMQSKNRHLLPKVKIRSIASSKQSSIADMAWTFCMLFINGAPLTSSTNCQ